MRRASTHTSHTQSHFPHIPLRPTEPKPLTQNYNRVFALPSELQHLSKLEGFESSTRHPFFFFNELLLFYKDKTFLFNCQIFFVFFFQVLVTMSYSTNFYVWTNTPEICDWGWNWTTGTMFFEHLLYPLSYLNQL